MFPTLGITQQKLKEKKVLQNFHLERAMNQQKMNSFCILKDQDVNIYYDVAMMTSQKSNSEKLIEPAARKEKKMQSTRKT